MFFPNLPSSFSVCQDNYPERKTRFRFKGIAGKSVLTILKTRDPPDGTWC